MKTEVKKWGNSLAVRLPLSLAKQLNISIGTEIDLKINKNKIEIHPLPKDTYSLEAMLANVTGDNKHGEIDTGSSLGAEI